MTRQQRPTRRPHAPHRGAVAVLAGAVLLLALSVGCAAGPNRPASPADRASELPDFPDYEAADAFLAMQARLRRYRPPPKEDYAFTEQNKEIYDDVQAKLQYSTAEMRRRHELEMQALRRHRAANLAEWDAMQGRLSQRQALDAARDAVIAENTRRNQRKFQERYSTYRRRLERLAQEAEQRAYQRDLNAYRNQQRIGARVAELRRQQEELRRFNEETRAANTAPAGASPTGRVNLPGAGTATAPATGGTSAGQGSQRLAPEAAAGASAP